MIGHRKKCHEWCAMKIPCDITGWWFGTLILWLSHILGIIIPTDFHIFQRGWNRQPVSINIPLMMLPVLELNQQTSRNISWQFDALFKMSLNAATFASFFLWFDPVDEGVLYSYFPWWFLGMYWSLRIANYWHGLAMFFFCWNWYPISDPVLVP